MNLKNELKQLQTINDKYRIRENKFIKNIMLQYGLEVEDCIDDVNEAIQDNKSFRMLNRKLERIKLNKNK